MSGCPTPSEIEDHLRGRLSDARRAQLEAHLESCAICHDALVELEIEILLPGSSRRSAPEAQTEPGPIVEPKKNERFFGPYRLIEELGRGGQARVYLVEDTRLPRRVALKVFQEGWTATEDASIRFRREAAALSRLDHPGICTVYESGELDGCPFIAMRHVEGESLAQRIARNASTASASQPLDAVKMVVLMERVARALHTAHEVGLVHRDIKPSNILISRDDEPVIVDFGLVRDEDLKERSLTRTGDLAGTPAYMSPELVLGDRRLINRRSDVFSLGVTLYEALTHSLPFDAPTAAGSFQRILEGQWTPPQSGGRALPRDLEVILATALERDIGRRYQTALAFAEDLCRFRKRETILARPAGTGLRLRRWTQRNPVVAVSLVAVLLVLATAVCISLTFLDRVRKESDFRAAALVREEGTRLALQASAVLGENPGQALLLAIEAAQRSPSLAANNALLSALQSSCERRRLFGHTGLVYHASFSGDGRRIVTAGADRTARVWDVLTGAMQATAIGHTADVTTAELSADGKRILTASLDATARIWEAETGKELLTLTGHEHGVTLARFSPNGTLALTVGRDTARLWDSTTGQALRMLAPQLGPMRCAAFSPDGAVLATGLANGTLILWDVVSGKELAALKGHRSSILDTRFSGDGKSIISSSEDGLAIVWESGSHKWVAELRGHQNPVRSALLSYDGALAATGSDDFTARVWDARTGKERFVLPHDHRVVHLEIQKERNILLTASYDGRARLWSASSGKLMRELKGHSSGLLHASFSPAGDLVATTSTDYTARIWSLATPWPRNASKGLTGNPANAWLDLSGRRVAAIFEATPNEAVLRRLKEDSSEGVKLSGHAGPITQLRFSPDNRSALTVSRDSLAKLWDVETGKLLRDFTGHSGPILGAGFSADGRKASTASEDRTVRIWDVDRGVELARVVDGASAFFISSLSPDGRHVLCGAKDGSLLLASAENGHVIRKLEDSTRHLRSAEWSPDGQRIVVANATNRVQIRNPFNGASLGVLVLGSRSDFAGYTPDGRWIAASCHDWIIRIWDARSLQEILNIKASQFMGHSFSFTAQGDRVGVYGIDPYTKTGQVGEQRGRLLLFPMDPLTEALAMRSGQLTPGERDQYEVGSARERADFRAEWKGGEVFGSGE